MTQQGLESRMPVATRPLAFARDYVITMRPYLLFISGITGLAGLSLAPPFGPGPGLLLFAVFFLAYGFGQALTDCFQMDTDAISSPYRPLVRGSLQRGQVLAVSLAGLLAGGLVLAYFSLWNLPLALLEVGGLATYTWFKRRWWGGPFYNAWIVAVLVLIGCVAGHGAAEARLTLPPGFWEATVVAFLAYANFVLAGYHKDVSADRATGYRTVPVVFGVRRSARASDALALAALLAAAVALAGPLREGFGPRWLSLCFFSAGLGTSVLAQVRLHRIPEETEAHRAITPVVHTYLFLLEAVVAAHRPAWIPALVLFHAAFALVLRSRPAREQV